VQQLFSRIRWRLIGWNILVLGLILLLLGGVVYAAASQTLLDEVDRGLYTQSEQAIPLVSPPPRSSDGPGGGRRSPEGYRGGFFYLVLLPDGSVVLNPQQVSIGELPSPQSGAPVLATVQLSDGGLARVILRRFPDGVMLVVGQSLHAEQIALRSLVVVLVAGGGLGLLLSLAAAWFLSGRALIPVQQAFQRQQEFVADASHELRTPLTVLRSATDLMNQHREAPLEANGELFDDVRAEIARMERLSQDLLTLARSDAGGLELMTAPLELADLAADVVRRTTPLAVSEGVELSVDADGQPATVEADPDRLQQVLVILIDNAIKHSAPGGKVQVHVRRHGQAAQVEVADTGSGIAAEHLPRIFDRFYRADKARARERGGTGLGLAIAKMLVEAHGGQLQLHSTLGVGTQAAVSLPLAHPPARLGGRLGELAAHLPGTHQ
jgi:signal transduction histidine kinase